MKISIKLFLINTFILLVSHNISGQSCSNGSYQWSDVSTIFSSYNCTTSNCHSGGAGGLDLSTYAGFAVGGNKCGTEMLDGTNLVDIIQIGATCGTTGDGTGGTLTSMNSRIGAAGPVSDADIAILQAYIDSGAFEACGGTPEDDGYDQCNSSVNEMADIGQTTICSDGSNLPVITPPSSSILPDVQIAVEINGSLVTVSDDGSFDASTLMPDDIVCYTAFAYNLADIQALLETANSLCPGLDFIFPDLLPCAPIASLLAGDNDGEPGLNNLLEVLDFASSLSTPINSVQSAVSTLNALNETIVPINLGPICYATSSNICLTVEECITFVELPTDDGFDQCASSVNEIGDIGVTGACSDGSNLPSITAPSSTILPDVQIAAEVNGELVGISDDGIFDATSTNFAAGDEVCYTAFAYNLADIQALLETASSLCPGLDFLFPDLLPCAPIAALLAGENDGEPGLNNLAEVLDFASSLSTPINSVQTAVSTLNALNETIVPINLGPICYAVSSNECIILSDDDCGPCSGGDVEIVLSVDMSCSGTDMRPPVVTGPFNGFSGDGNIMIDPDGDDIWEAVICAAPDSQFEYKYAILNFVEQENLVDDAIGGANGNTCNLNTNFFDFANRLITIPAGGGALPTDGYGICGSCDEPPINVTFSVNMNCSDVAPGTPVAMFGGFNGFCCEYGLQDADGDNVWTTTLPFPADADGCISMQYLYMSPGFSNVESFLTNGEDIANCPNIFSDFNEFANRIIEVCSDVVLDEYWNSCAAPEEPAGGCDDGDCANGTETWDGCECIVSAGGDLGCTNPDACNFDPSAACDDGSCQLPPAEPTDLECYQMTTFDAVACDWTVTGDQPAMPTDLACYETASFNDATCVWDVAGEQPMEPTTACYETATFNDATCVWDVTGMQPIEPTTACYETATFNDATCVWDVTGEQPAQPTDLACYESVGAFDDATCAWQILGEQPNIDDGCDLTTDTFDDATCLAVNTSNCPANTSFNSVDCLCEEDVIPGCTDICASNYNPMANSDDGSCMLPEEPVTACYETATFNETTCMWEVSGLQPDPPLTACYETATFNDETCSYDVTGEQPAQPTDLECYETVDSFDDATCSWIVVGEQPAIDDNCDITIDTFDETTCSAVNTPDCPAGTSFDATNCVCTSDPVSGCMDATACNYDPNATVDNGSCTFLPEEPTDLACYETAEANLATCSWDIMGIQPTIDDGCDVTVDSFDDITCMAVNTPDCPAGTSFDSDNCACVTEITCDDPCAPNFGEGEACEPYDMTCPEDTCFEFYTWDATSCMCIVAVVDYNCDDANDCTTDSVDPITCECVNELIVSSECSDPVCVPPTPGTIDCE